LRKHFYFKRNFISSPKAVTAQSSSKISQHKYTQADTGAL